MADDASFAFEPALQTVSGQVTVRFTGSDGVLYVRVTPSR